MKTIGLIGGMSWESSTTYYQLINRKVREELGGVNSCQCLLYSVNFAEIAPLMASNEWDKIAVTMVEAAQKLEKAGADLIILCTNSIHKVADSIENNTKIPFLHIVDATAEEIKKQGFTKVGLLGTRYSMEEDFLKNRFSEKYGIEIIVPEKKQRDIVHNIVFDELVKGIIKKKSRTAYLNIIDELIKSGAQAIILGCTEIGLLINQSDTSGLLFDTAVLHAEKAVEIALNKK